MLSRNTSEAQTRTSNFFESNLPQLKDRLRKAGFESINDIVTCGDANVISKVTGLDPRICKGIYESARALTEKETILHTPIQTASDIQKIRVKLRSISTGSRNLDKLFGGHGIETCAVTQLYGESAAGKTQLCHYLCIMVKQRRVAGGLNGKACYIDTEGKFRSERIIEIANARGLESEEILQNIIVERPQNVTEQELILEKVKTNIVSQNILIVDSVINHYRAEYSELSDLPEKQKRLFKFMHDLQEISQTDHIAVVVTNQVQTGLSSHIDAAKPMGGNVLSHTSTYVVQLRMSGENRTAKMVSSPYHPYSDAKFTICEHGIDDPEDWT